MTIAFLDVAYGATGARAACVVADSWQSESPTDKYVCDIEQVDAYEPGMFYRRELPCLLAVLKLLPVQPDVVIVDGYVWLSSDARPGLGAHLYEALDRKMPIVGIAKTAFHGADSCPIVAKVFRGGSSRPLFVTSVGMGMEDVEERVRCMAGAHRIPALLSVADQLSRSSGLLA